MSTHEFCYFSREQTGKFKKKYRISASYQPAEQNLLHVKDIFKDTVDLRECPSEYSLNGLFGVQPN